MNISYLSQKVAILCFQSTNAIVSLDQKLTRIRVLSVVGLADEAGTLFCDYLHGNTAFEHCYRIEIGNNIINLK